MPRSKKSKLPPGQCELPFANPGNLLEHITAFGNDHNFAPRNKPQPTDLEPGPERVEIYAQRIMSGEDLWHPDDPQVDVEAMSSLTQFFDLPDGDEDWDDD